MRFGFKTSPQNTTWDAVRAVWQAADDMDVFESGWVSDHFYPVHTGDLSGSRLEGWITMTALAQATRRLRLGTLVTGVHHRHPAVLANMAATLDIVSGGRLELGIGAGWNEQESGAYGIELGTPRERSDRFEEACEVLTGLLSPQETTTFKGSHYELTDARCNPKPVQQPHLPIWIGGNGEQRTLRTAARFAHYWSFDGESTEQFSRARDVLYQHCAAIGRNPAEILLCSQVGFAGDPPATAAAAAAFGAAGVDFVIVSLRRPYTPTVLEPLATALSELS